MGFVDQGSDSRVIDHDQTLNRTHDGDSIRPDDVDANTVSARESFTDPGGVTYTGRIGADTRRAVNQLFIQSARQDFELGLSILNFDDGQFEIYANDDRIETSADVDITFGSPLEDAGIVELEDGATSGFTEHVEGDFGFLTESVWVTDDVPTLPANTTVEYEIEDENGNVVTIERDSVDDGVDVTDEIETYGARTRAFLKRDSTDDDTPVLDAYSVYFSGTVPDEYLDAEIESVVEA